MRAKKSAEKDIAKLARTSAAAASASSSTGSEKEQELQGQVNELMVRRLLTVYVDVAQLTSLASLDDIAVFDV